MSSSGVEMDKLRVGVVGVGHLGFHHARNYARMPDVELAAVVDIDGDRAQEVASELEAKWFTRSEDVIGRVDAVSIAVPTTSHHDVAMQFLSEGIHTLVEKPLTSTVEDGRALVEKARSSGLVLQVGHVERYNPAVEAVVSHIEEPRFIECHRLAPFVPRGVDVDVVLDLMIHDIHLAQSFVRASVKNVDAIGVAVLTPTEDIANARLEFQNGCVANLTASRVSKDKLRKVRVFQRNCYVSIDCLQRRAEVYAKSNEPEGRELLSSIRGDISASPSGVDPTGLIVKQEVPVEQEEPLYCELRDFVTSIRESRTPRVDGEQGLAALEVAFSVVRKLRER
jgi:predicted dehydrogenase